ncbi:MAG: hypothetical protein NBV68_09710 [Erythrobacter sp.]|uniref:DUF6916 family protein n=1 Tax=Erythrobacter sp. TaxID=1042 RepID=UPI0025EB6075|nr:hypothetical protein [Erythrobacter sp.]MCL9999648.1 hypothetical protein [Erythrobacter sp.]
MTNQPEAAAPPLTLELFQPEVGSTFTVAFPDARFDLELREATALGFRDPHVHSRHPFTLLFVCPDRRALAQGTYAIDHERLGMLEIFLVPVGADTAGVQYEAIFN